MSGVGFSQTKGTAMATIDANAITVKHDGSELDQYSIAAQFAVNGLDGFRGTMTAAAQRALLGSTPFGRKTVAIDCSGCGTVKLVWKCSFGQDSQFLDLTFAELAERINPPASAKLVNIL
jgi:hypothetical protein